MLSDEEKARIEAEETYRARTRKKAEKQEAKRKANRSRNIWMGVVAVIVLLFVLPNAINGASGSQEPARAAAPTPPIDDSPKANVTFTSDPEGANVIVLNSNKGKTPVTVAVPMNQEVNYRIEPTEPYEDYDLYKAYNGKLNVSEDNAVNVWLERTTAEEQESQKLQREVDRAAAEVERQAAARAAQDEKLAGLETTIRRSCNDLVKNALKAPSTAKFPGLLSGEWDYRYNPSAGTAVYSSHVDSQNGFGAMIRSRFTCEYTPTEFKSLHLSK